MMEQRSTGSDEPRATEETGVGGGDENAPSAEPRMGGFEGLAEPPASEDSSATGDSLEQLEGLQAELEALNDRHLRLAAEFDNYRKRANREREEIRLRGEADLVAKLLDPLDDLLRVSSLDQGSTSVEALLEGVQLVEKKLRQALGAAGLERLDPAGEFFDPASMEALMTAPAEHPEEDDVVDQVLQRGYRFHGSLVRPARVRVKKYEE